MPSRLFDFIFLYGVAGLIGAVLTVFWGIIANGRRKVITHNPIKDRAFVLAFSIMLTAGGITLTDTARGIGNAEYGLSSILQHDNPAFFIAAGLVFVICGLLMMGWLADLEKHPPKWIILKSMLGLTIFWGIAAMLLCGCDP